MHPSATSKLVDVRSVRGDENLLRVGPHLLDLRLKLPIDMREPRRHVELLRKLLVFIELKILENLRVGYPIKVRACSMKLDIGEVLQRDRLIMGQQLRPYDHSRTIA